VKASRLLMAVAVTGILSIASPDLMLAQDTGTQSQGQTQGGAQASGGTAAQGPQKNWKDRNEYDLYVSITKETDPHKKIDLLNQWQSKYPNTEFKDLRDALFLTTYAALNQPQQTIDAAKTILATDPSNFQALYFTTIMAPQITPVTPDVLDQAEKAANGLIAAIPTQFDASKKPAQVSQTDWDKAKTDTEALAHTTLGWVAMQRKDYAKAETEFTQSLQQNPAAGQVSYWLGTVILAEKDPNKQAPALYEFARAAAYDGAGSLNPAGRAQVKQYLTKAYTDYHGGADGLDQLLAQAKTAAIPPGGLLNFKILSTADKAAEEAKKQQELAQQNPSLALWLNLKNELTGANGESYFNTNMKGAQTPAFTGALVSEEPETRPRKLVLAIADGKTPDCTIELESPLPGKADPGTQITFQGIAQSYTANPFMVTFKAEKANVKGWPGKEAPVHHPARRRRG